MSKAKNGFIFGAIILVICNLVTKFLSAIYKVPLLRVLGSEGLGQYQMIFPIYALFLVISSSGIVVTISKLTSKQLEVKNYTNAKRYFFAGFLLSLFSSTILSVLLLILSPALSKFQANSNLTKSYIAIVPAIIFGSLMTALRGYFLGKKKMGYSGLMQIIEATSKLVFSLSFAIFFAKKSYFSAVFGAILGLSVSEMVSFLFSIMLYLFSKNKEKRKYTSMIFNKKRRYFLCKSSCVCDGFNEKKYNVKNRYISFFYALKKVVTFSFFVMMQACAIPLVSAVDSLIVVPLLLKTGLSQAISFSLYGLEDGIVSSIISLPTFVATAIGASIIPNIKKENANNELTIKNIKNSFSIVWLVSIFCAFVFLFFSKEIIIFLYGGGLTSFAVNELQIASDLLKINSFNIIYLSLIIISTSILQALEKNKAPVINLFCAAILRTFFLLILVSSKKVNIYGTAICDMVFYSFALYLNLISIRRIVQFKLNINKLFVLPTISCLVMSIVMKLFNSLLYGYISSRFLTMIILILGVVLYYALLCITKTINTKEILSVWGKNKRIKITN
ncbi:MAG: oligosaccharide flippase family protein [Clostridia bacterium]|nr:oligosaccharide flippase family protein [Clostridia bacterium]